MSPEPRSSEQDTDSSLPENILRRVLEILEEPEERQDQEFDRLGSENPEHASEIRRCQAAARGGETFERLLQGFSALEQQEDGPASRWREGLPGRIGPYRILEPLGQGGMGAVFVARHEELGRRVALKLIRPERLLFQGAMDRFRREARMASRLDHPGICQVYEIGEDSGLPYMAMRLIDGESLARRISRARESLPSQARRGSGTSTPASRKEVIAAVQLIEKAARALHAAHEAELVHRDIKPGNLMVDGRGEPVILDFGLARDDTEGRQSLTLTGERLGTPLYMSPEQISPKGRLIDRRSDVYSLGVSLYELLTLHRPFEAPTVESVYLRILHDEVPRASQRNRAVPRDLDIVLATAMDRDRDRRYRSALDFAEDLRRVREHEPIRARAAGRLLRTRRWVQRNPALASLLLVLLSALGVTSWLLRVANEAHAETLRTQASLAPFTLEGLIREAEEDLWPAHPRMVPAMDRWLERAGELVAGLEQRAESAGQVGGLETFVSPDAEVGTMARVRARRAFAASLHQRSVEDYAEEWEEIRRVVAGDERFGKVELRPQLGLVPLGRDPVSGFQEFAHLLTGEAAERVNGKLRIDSGTGLVLVLLPGGSFLMGAQNQDLFADNYDEDRRTDENLVHRVTLAPFFLSKYEMTQGQWQRFTGKNPSTYNDYGNPRSRLGPTSPVERVSWDDCSRVLARLDLKLPTEAQWEYACRAGSTTAYSTGARPRSLQGFANISDRTLSKNRDMGPSYSFTTSVEDGFQIHARVGSFAPNGFGLHDMHGNVEEWCLDRYGRYAIDPRPGDGLREDPESDPRRVRRGGCWARPAEGCRSAVRFSNLPDFKNGWIGIRPARALER